MSAPEPVGASAKPRVLAVVMARGEHLEETLASLAGQTWPQLSVVVVDAGTAEVDPAPAARRHGATVIHLPGARGLAQASDAVLSDTGFGGDWRLFVTAGTVLEPDCVTLLVDSAEAAGAGVAGPKLVEVDDPSVLVEVGLSADRFAVAFTPVDPGEVDHGQHDGTREVLFVSVSCLLVRAALFAELNGFDPDYDDEAIDLDLCWRARVVDGPVLVVPEARARVRAGALATASTAVSVRNRLRTMIKCYSFFRLAASLIALSLLGVAEMTALALARRGPEARAVAMAWWWNLRHLPSGIRQRWRVQRHRHTPDAAVRRLQTSGTARVREYLESRIEARTAAPLTESGTGEHLAEDLRTVAARPQVVFWVGVLFLTLLGSRALLVGALPRAGQLLPAPASRGLLAAYAAPWRLDGFGAPGGGPVHLALFALVRLAGLGSLTAGLRLFLVGGYVFGLVGAWRAVGRIEPWPAPALAVVVYGLSPVLLAATERGDVGAFWMWVLAPYAVCRLLDAFDGRLPPLPSMAAGALVVAAAATLFPLAPAVHVGLATAVLVGGLLAGRRAAAVVTWLRGVAMAAGAVVLLFPWSGQVVGMIGRRGFLRAAYLDWHQLRVAVGAGEAIRGQLGTVGGGVAGAAPALLGLLALLVARGSRLDWSIRLWAVALTGMALLYVAGQDAVPAAPRLLVAVSVPLALSLAALVGLSAAAARRDLPDYPLGWRHVAAVVLFVGLALGSLPALGRLVRSGRGGWTADRWPATSVFVGANEADRVLWLGRPSALPGDPHPLAGTTGAYVVTTGAPDLGDILPVPTGVGDAALADALGLVRDGTTQRAGRLLAPFGIRFVVVVPDSPAASVDGPPPDPNLVGALSKQLDLAEKRVDPALLVFENTSAVPGPELVDRPEAVAVARTVGPPLADALTSIDLRGTGPPLERAGRAGFAGRVDTDSGGVILVPQVFDKAWQARLDGGPLEAIVTFGWAQGFVVPPGSHGRVVVEPSGSALRVLALLLQLCLLVGALYLWRRRPVHAGGDDGTATVEPAGRHLGRAVGAGVK